MLRRDWRRLRSTRRPDRVRLRLVSPPTGQDKGDNLACAPPAGRRGTHNLIRAERRLTRKTRMENRLWWVALFIILAMIALIAIFSGPGGLR